MDRWIMTACLVLMASVSLSCRKPAPATESTAVIIHQAMRTLYGNYDPATQQSRRAATPPSEPGSMEVAAAQVVTADGKRELLLFTSAGPDSSEPYDCHACGFQISAARFELDGDRLIRKAYHPDAFVDGSWGIRPTGEIVQWGENRWGLRVSGGFTGQGITVSSERLYAWKNDRLENIYNIGTLYDNSGTLQPESEKRTCEVTVKFGKPGPAGAFDLILTKDKSKTTTLVYDGSQYVDPKTKAHGKDSGCEGA